jgi:hypothetical protein
LIRLGERSPLTSAAVLTEEFQTAPVSAVVAAARARAFQKYHFARAIIGDLVRNRHGMRTRQRTWATGTQQWLRRMVPAVPTSEEDRTGAIAARLVKAFSWERYLRQEGGNAGMVYAHRCLQDSVAYVEDATRRVHDACGVHYLTRARVGALGTAGFYARIGWLPERYRRECPFCHTQGRSETLVHMLLECPCWDEQRESFLSSLVQDATLVAGPEGSQLDVVILLLGGRLSNGAYLTDWSRDVPLQGNEGMRRTEVAERGTERRPAYLRVAQFLVAVMLRRLPTLSRLLTTPHRANAMNGRAALDDAPPMEEIVGMRRDPFMDE